MMGILFAVIAGAAMSLQGVLNARLADHIGLYESNAFVQGTAFALSLLALFIAGKGQFSAITQVKWVYLLGGALGLVITLTVMLGMQRLGPVMNVAVILISQLLVAAVIDALGLFGVEKTPFFWNKFLGLGLMLGGVILFQMKR